jgi:hypothetical protein
VETWALIAATALVLSLPLAWRVAQGRFDPFEPIVLFSLAWGAMFVVRPASMLVDDHAGFWGVDVLPTLPRAVLLALVGAVGFVVGYELRAGRSVARRLPIPTPIVHGAAVAGALVAAGVAVVALAVALPVSDGLEALRILVSGRSEELGALLADESTYVWYGSLLSAPASLVLLGVALRRPTVLAVAALAAAVVLALARVAPTGGRIVLLPLIGGAFVLLYLVRGRRPGTVTLAALAIAGLLGSYLTLAYRDPTDDYTLRDAVERLQDEPQAVFDPVLRGADAEMVLALSAALTVVPDELPHRFGGATVGNLLTRPIPRELWEGKPLPPGEEVVSTVWPHLYPGLDPAFSPLLVLYWDFGLAGVALGMLLFGLLWRTLFEWFLLHRRELGAQLVFASSLWFVVIGARNDPVDTIVLAAFLVAPVVLVVVTASSGTQERVRSAYARARGRRAR